MKGWKSKMDHEAVKRFTPREAYLFTVDSMELVTVLVSDYTEEFAIIKDKNGQIRAENIGRLRIIGD